MIFLIEKEGDTMEKGSIRIKKITKEVLQSPLPVYDVVDAQPYNNFLVVGKDGYLNCHNCCLL